MATHCQWVLQHAEDGLFGPGMRVVCCTRLRVDFEGENLANLAQQAGFDQGVLVVQEGLLRAGKGGAGPVGDANVAAAFRVPEGVHEGALCHPRGQGKALDIQQLTGRWRGQGANEVVHQPIIPGQEVEHVLEAEGNIRSFVGAVEAHVEMLAMQFARDFEVPQGHPGQLSAHAGAGQDHGTDVEAVIAQVTQDVGQEEGVVPQVCRAVGKVNQDGGESAIAKGVQQDRHVGHHGVGLHIAPMKLPPSKIAMAPGFRGPAQAEINAFHEDERPM